MTRFTFALIAASIATYASCRGHRIEPAPEPDAGVGGSSASSSTGTPEPMPACMVTTQPVACPQGLDSECRGPKDNPCMTTPKCGEGHLCESERKPQGTGCDPGAHDNWHYWCEDASENGAPTSKCCAHREPYSPPASTAVSP